MSELFAYGANTGGGGGGSGSTIRTGLPMARGRINTNLLHKVLLYRAVRNSLIGYRFCNQRCLSTYDIDHRLHQRPIFKRLKKKIEKECEKLSNGDGRGYISSMWINVGLSDGKVEPHHHNPKKQPWKISGVYYLSKPEGSGNLIIYNPTRQVINVETNDLIIFSADMVHESEINTTNEYRIACGFNFFQR